MSNKNAVNPIGQPLREQSPLNGIATEPRVESRSDATVDQGEIAALAYRLWLERGCPEGSPEEDWFLAERELLWRGEPIAAP
jgi:hypothetical protein